MTFRWPALVAASLLTVALPAAADAGCVPGAPGTILWAAGSLDDDPWIDFVRVSRAGGVGSSPVVVADDCLDGPIPLLGTGRGGRLELRDIDTDADLDVVEVDELGAPVRAWLNDGHGFFTVAAPEDVPSRALPTDEEAQPAGALVAVYALSPRSNGATVPPAGGGHVDVCRVARWHRATPCGLQERPRSAPARAPPPTFPCD